MTKQTQLISLYCAICQYYSSTLAATAQRLSNNFCPEFTDEECMTIYIFGIQEQKYTVKAIYNFIRDYYGDWFPKLPKYQNFNRRVCYLAETLKHLVQVIVSSQGAGMEFVSCLLLDSMPIIVAGNRRSGTARVAGDICDKGYCSSKGMYYYGVKLHALAMKRYQTLPDVHSIWLSPASTNDLTSAKTELYDVYSADIYADKMYADKSWAADMLSDYAVKIITPVKLKKGQQALDSADKAFNAAVSSVRQAIESFFNWLQEKTHIQAASKIRSSGGLIAFIFARLAAVLMF